MLSRSRPPVQITLVPRDVRTTAGVIECRRGFDLASRWRPEGMCGNQKGVRRVITSQWVPSESMLRPRGCHESQTFTLVKDIARRQKQVRAVALDALPQDATSAKTKGECDTCRNQVEPIVAASCTSAGASDCFSVLSGPNRTT
jgi:hypothetical protein